MDSTGVSPALPEAFLAQKIDNGLLPWKIDAEQRQHDEAFLVQEKRIQPGIGFPSASVQTHLLVVRINLAPSPPQFPGFSNPGTPADLAEVRKNVREGLQDLCDLFERIDKGRLAIEVLDKGVPERRSLSEFHFSATVGFGSGFFRTLDIPEELRPKLLRPMPDHLGLGDLAPYSLGQTDLIVQLASSSDFVNRWALENAIQPVLRSSACPPTDIVTAVQRWAIITDVHAGFQRTDGRNLQGFNDGVSNPRRLSPLFHDTVWVTEKEESNPELRPGTYMVFQKIVHDLDQWRSLSVREQEEWVGRSKGTGLLLGTLPPAEDAELTKGLRSDDPVVRAKAAAKWKPLFDHQSDPQVRFFDREGDTPEERLNGKPKFADIPNRCPAWAHVRQANPREENGLENVEAQAKLLPHLIFRRGYPFMEPGADNRIRSGLLFVCFQKDITDRFEFIKRAWFNNVEFTVPFFRPFTEGELAGRHRQGRFSEAELREVETNSEARVLLGLVSDEAFSLALQEAQTPDTQGTGREGLSAPSENGAIPTGQFLATVTQGGGYYFVPPIPNRRISQIGQQFFPTEST